ncbi:MAG: hypothetical protein HQL32_09835 [Planctomycetes bacterium]|nr:hypothetical protein [Planctomycetota bacterium]
MDWLDSEQVNPLSGKMAVAGADQSLITSVQLLSPSIERLGVDITEFQKSLRQGAREIRRLWTQFILREANKVLMEDLNRLVELATVAFDKKEVSAAEVNGIINFVLSFNEVIHQKHVNKKDVIEGILMRGIIKKSSFYQKLSKAENSFDAKLSWAPKATGSDDIWRHFMLQTCRFMKQAVIHMEHILEDGSGIRSRLQEIIDRDEYEQFNQMERSRLNQKLTAGGVFALGLAVLLGGPFQSTDMGAESGSIAVEDNAALEKTLPVPQGIETETQATPQAPVHVSSGTVVDFGNSHNNTKVPLRYQISEEMLRSKSQSLEEVMMQLQSGEMIYSTESRVPLK